MSDAPKRPSLREAARRGAEANRREREARAILEGTTSVAPTPPPAADQPPSRTEPVQARCGHAVPFTLYPDAKDKFREARRRHVADRDCPECRQKAHEARTAAEMTAARQRRRDQAKRAAPVRDRLPHGSRFDGLVWDAEKGRWSGTLTVPDPAAAGGVRTFEAAASGVFQLLRPLDGMYREALGEQGGPPAVTPTDLLFPLAARLHCTHPGREGEHDRTAANQDPHRPPARAGRGPLPRSGPLEGL